MKECDYCERVFSSSRSLKNHVGQVHPDAFPWNNEKLLRKRYVVQGYSRSELAEKWECTEETISNACERHGIEMRSRGPEVEYPEHESPECLRWLHQEQGLTAKEMAAVIGSSRGSVYRCLQEYDIEYQWEGPWKGISGEGHPVWKGGHEENRGYTWQEQHRYALERDEFICQHQECDVADSEHREQRGSRIHVHHVIRYGAFEECENANQIVNLVTLCEEHHRILEHRDLSTLVKQTTWKPTVEWVELAEKAKGKTLDDAREDMEILREYIHDLAEDTRQIQPADSHE